VESKYEKQLETLEELLDSDVVNDYHPLISSLQDTLPYPEFVKFFDHKKLKEDCSDVRKCVERMIIKRDIASFIPTILAAYVASEMRFVDVGKVICSLDEALFSVGVTIIFKKGNPLLDKFSILLSLYVEGGLFERL